jgi:subtilisin
MGILHSADLPIAKTVSLGHNRSNSTRGSKNIFRGRVFRMSFGLRARLSLAAAVILVQLFSIGLVPHSSVAAAQQDFSAAAVPNRYIVTLKPGSGLSAASVASTYSGKPGAKVDRVYSNVIDGFAGEFTEAALEGLRQNPNVASITPDFIVYADAQTNPEGVRRVDADLNPTVAGNGSGSVSVDVAVLDSGVYQHEDLNVVGGTDCTGGGNPYSDYNGHGTHVAGTIGAYDNGIGVVGVAPGARIHAVKVLGNAGEGSWSWVMCGLDWVAARSSTIEVVNMSLGADIYEASNSCSYEPLHQSICNVVSRGVTVVVAAGNDGANSATYAPAQYDEVITVSAYYDTDGLQGGLGPSYFPGYCDDCFANFSNWGADVDIAAPGVDVLSTASALAYSNYLYCQTTQKKYCWESGTSMASPHVAGAAALILAQQGDMSPASVRTRLRLTGEPGPVDGDFDSYAEPLLNVAFLGKGKIVAPSSAKVGDVVQVRVGDFTPGTRATFRFGGTFIGGDTIDEEGRGHRNYTLPNMPGGSYEVKVTNTLKTVTKKVTVAASISANRTSAPVGESVTVTLRGFKAGEVVDVKMGSKLVVNDKVVSSSGFGTASFVVPATPGGYYALAATGNKGSSASVNLKVAPSAWLDSGSPAPGAAVTIAYRGFKVGENIVMRFDAQDGAVANTPTETASSTGSGSDGISIPAASAEGNRYLWLIGDQGSKVRITLTIGPAGLPEPTPTETATAAPTETVVVETPTEAPTEIPTDIPTETPVPETPTEGPTEEPTVEGSPAGV